MRINWKIILLFIAIFIAGMFTADYFLKSSWGYWLGFVLGTCWGICQPKTIIQNKTIDYDCYDAVDTKEDEE
jgi:hypothetical protein